MRGGFSNHLKMLVFSLFISLLCENSSTSRMQCLLFPWSTEGQQAKTEEEFSSSYGSCTHTVLLWLPNVEWIILIDFASLLFLFLLYPLLCLCTVNSLLPCVSSDNELKFRGGSFTVRLAFFHYTWNPSTLRFHKKQTNKQINKTRQQQKQKHLNEGWSLHLYTQLLQLGKESLKKNPACTGFEPLTSAILVHRYRRGQGNESRTSRNFFSGFLFATAKVAYITAIIILHLSVFVLLLLLSCFVCLFVCFFFTETVMCWGFT